MFFPKICSKTKLFILLIHIILPANNFVASQTISFNTEQKLKQLAGNYDTQKLMKSVVPNNSIGTYCTESGFMYSIRIQNDDNLKANIPWNEQQKTHDLLVIVSRYTLVNGSIAYGWFLNSADATFKEEYAPIFFNKTNRSFFLVKEDAVKYPDYLKKLPAPNPQKSFMSMTQTLAPLVTCSDLKEIFENSTIYKGNDRHTHNYYWLRYASLMTLGGSIFSSFLWYLKNRWTQQ